MWYRTAKKLALAQEFNIPGPIYSAPGTGPRVPVWSPPTPRKRRTSIPELGIPETTPNDSVVSEQEPPQTVMPPLEEASEKPIPKSIPDDGIPDQPKSIPLSSMDEKILTLRPPLHDRCHCDVETLPGGRMIWNANEGACPQCQQIAQRFNELQSAQFGV